MLSGCLDSVFRILSEIIFELLNQILIQARRTDLSQYGHITVNDLVPDLEIEFLCAFSHEAFDRQFKVILHLFEFPVEICLRVRNEMCLVLMNPHVHKVAYPVLEQ